MMLLNTTWLSPAFCFLGMALISLAMDRHYAQVFSRRELACAARIALRLAGASVLAVALVLALDAWGASVGWVAWLGWLTVGALAVALLLAYAPRALLALTALGAMAFCTMALVITVPVLFI